MNEGTPQPIGTDISEIGTQRAAQFPNREQGSIPPAGAIERALNWIQGHITELEKETATLFGAHHPLMSTMRDMCSSPVDEHHTGHVP
jgi:hypothetical protein